MKKNILIFTFTIILSFYPSAQTTNNEKALEIIKKIDNNMFSKTQIVTSEMIVYGKRKKRIIRSKGYSKGKENNYTEYLSPEREKGTKMLKLDKRLWIYSPSTDRTIQLSGHLLRQSVMGSDLSYEDMMEERKLSEVYTAEIVNEDIYIDSPVLSLGFLLAICFVAYNLRLKLSFAYECGS